MTTIDHFHTTDDDTGELFTVRKEVWPELVQRVTDGSLDFVNPNHWAPNERERLFAAIYNMNILPAGRHLWVTGTDNRYSRNCWVVGFKEQLSWHFAWQFSRLMEGGGTGANYSQDLINMLPPIAGRVFVDFICDPAHPDIAEMADFVTGDTVVGTTFQVPDSREGWAEAISTVIDLGAEDGDHHIVVDVSKVRPKGAELKTMGGTASGPAPLVRAIAEIATIINRKHGAKLDWRACMDIDHATAQAVVAGGVRRCLPAGSRVHTARGAVRIEEVRVGDVVQTVAGEAPVTAVFEQGVQDTIRIAHEFGTFECTPNHQVAVFDSLTTWTFKAAGDLTASDHLVWDFNGSEGDPAAVMPAHDGITELTVDGSHRRANGFAKNTGRFDTDCSIDLCPDKALVLTPDPLCSRHYQRAKKYGDPLYVKARRGEFTVPELDADTAWLIGLVHGDGYIHLDQDGTRGAVMVAFSPDHQEVIDYAEKVFARFGVDHLVTHGPSEGDRSTKLTARRVEMARWFHTNVKQAKTALDVPEWIFAAPRDVRAAYIAGVFDADGSALTRPLQILSTVYRGFADQIQQLLASLGIASVVKPVSGNAGRTAMGWQEQWSVNTVGRESAAQIDAWFGLYSKKHSPNPGRTEGTRGFGFTREFGRQHGLGVYGGKKNVRYPVAITEQLSGRSLPAWPVRVKGISAGRSVETFDIEVDGLHQFTAEGFVVHNSARMAMLHWADPGIFEFIDCKADHMSHWSTNISVEVDEDYFVALDDASHPLHEHANKVLDLVALRAVTNGEPGFANMALANVGERERVRCSNPCGEIFMSGIDLRYGESCNLGHVNLANFVGDNEGAEEMFRLVTRFLIRATMNTYPEPLAAEVEGRNRRIGVGILGFQEWLVGRGVKWSESATDKTTRRLLNHFREVVREEADRFCDELGIPRCIKVTTVAPTGTISQLAGVTSGIHPVLFRYFIRNVRYSDNDPALPRLASQGYVIRDDIYAASTKVVSFPVLDPIVARFPDLVDLIEEQGDLSVDQMLAVQAMVQETWCGGDDGNAVSFTVNMPAGLAPDDAREALRKWLPQLKGTTLFPNESRPMSPYEPITQEFYLSEMDRLGLAVAVGAGDLSCKGAACPVR